MKLIGLMPCRNEDWCLGLTARAALMWCDALVMLNHASTDNTADILSDVMNEEPRRVYLCKVKNETWDEMQHRQIMLEMARAMGATHIALIDADEILAGNFLNGHPHADPLRDGQMLQLPGYNLRGGLHKYHSNGLWANRWFSTAFRDRPVLTWKGDRFHHREPMGTDFKPYRPVAQHDGGVMHLWGVSERRLRAKHALYKVSERVRWPEKPVADIDRMYSWWRSPQDIGPQEIKWTYRDVPAEWWAPYRDLMPHLHVDAVPWQEAEVQRIVHGLGAQALKGLDLFGVV